MTNHKQIASVIICDDVRLEINGKHILIGVYANYIIVPAMPFTLPISIWFEYMPRKIGKEEILLSLSYIPNGVSATMKIELDIKELSAVGISTPQIALSGATNGHIVAAASTDAGKKWAEIKKKEVRQGQIMTHQLLGKLPLPTA